MKTHRLLFLVSLLVWCGAPLFAQAVAGDPLLKGQADVDGAEIIDDAVDTAELADGADTPLVSEFVATDSATATDFEYLSAGAGITVGAADVSCTSSAAATLGCVELDNAFAGTAAAPEIASTVAGDGIVLNTGTTPDSFDLDLNGTVDGVGSTGNLSGLEITATNEIALIQGCADTEILKWVNGTSQWDCAADDGSNPLSIASPAAVELTAGGEATLTGGANTINYHTLDSTGASGDDNWESVVCTAGSYHVIQPLVGTRTVTVQASTLAAAIADFLLDGAKDRWAGHCHTANTIVEEKRSNNEV